MSIRTVRYQIIPALARPASIPAGQDLTFDVADVAAPAMQEVLRTAAGTVSLQAMLEELLVPQVQDSDPLIWLKDGVGIGTEMKRGFSGILGRFFARWYLQAHHGLTHFVPIDGEGAIVSNNVVVRRTGRFHLPDWICIDDTGRPTLAESKGSHNKAQWLVPSAAEPLQKAQTQLRNAVVQVRSSTTGSLDRFRTKGWAVMSRWGTVENECPPLLYALDPETKGLVMEDKEASIAGRDICRASLAGYMQALGHADLASRLAAPSHEEQTRLHAESDQAELRWAETLGSQVSAPIGSASARFLDTRRSVDRPKGIPMEAVLIADDQLANRRFIGGVVDLTGRLMSAAVSSILQGRSAGPTQIYRGLYFAGVDMNVLGAALEGAAQPRLSPIRINRPKSDAALPNLSVLRDGFVFTPLEALSEDTEAAPENLARSES